MLAAGIPGKGSYGIPRKGILVADALGTVACGAETQFTVLNHYSGGQKFESSEMLS